MKHSNIAVFIPHVGCPHACSFCSQYTITGSVKAPTIEEVRALLMTAVTNSKLRLNETEIAFFGGSFTAIEPTYRTELLAVAYEFVKEYGLKGIRISTRPDAISSEILEELANFGVTSIELGAQSMNDEILRKNHRGHTAQDVCEAVRLIRLYPQFELGLQMMVGLYGDSMGATVKTAEEIVRLKPDTVRIYPTVILANTDLAKLYQSGEYQPMSLENAVQVCAQLLELFEQNHIRVIKLGLHASEQTEEEMIGGIYHPAFRELCESERYYHQALKQLKEETEQENRTLFVHPKELSKMIGQQGKNREKLQALGYVNLKICGDETLEIGQVR